MTIRYDVTIEDIVAFSRYHWAQSPEVQKMTKTRWRAQISLAILLFIGSRYLPLTSELSHPIAMSLAVAAAVINTAVSWLLCAACRRLCMALVDYDARRSYSAGTSEGVLGEHQLEVDEDGIIERTAVNESFHRWRAIDQIAESDKHVFIYFTSLQAYVIPRHFVIAGNLDAFVDRAKKFWVEARPEKDRWGTSEPEFAGS